MKIGIIGVGTITMGFAQKAAKSGYEVLISGPCHHSMLKEIALRIGDNVKAVTINEVGSAEIIIMFSPLESLRNLIGTLPDMKEKVILHTNNAILSPACLLLPAVGNSSSELVGSLLPTSHIVKVFTTAGPTITNSNNSDQNTTDIYFAAKNKKAKHSAKIFFNTLGLSSVDLSELCIN